VQSLGFGVRNVIEGVSSLPDIVASPLNTGLNALGMNLSTTPFADAGRNISDAIGLPTAQDGTDEFLGAVERGGAAALVPAVGATAAVGRGGGYIAQGLAAQPLGQLVSGMTASGSSDAIRQMGGGVAAQTIGGLVGGLSPVAGAVASQGVRSAAGLVTRSGAMDTAAQTLKSLASDPAKAASNIRYAPVQVSGAAPTLGEAAGDAGLAGLQRGHANTNPSAAAAVGERMQLNAIARTKAADEALGPGSPQRIQDAAAERVQDAQAVTARQRAEAQTRLDQRLLNDERALTGAADASRTRLGDIAGRVGPLVDRTATGSAAREAFGNSYNAARARTREAYNSPILEDNPPVQLRPLDPSQMRLPNGPAAAVDLDGFKREAVTAARGALPPQPRSLLQLARSYGIGAGSVGADDLRASGLGSRGAPALVRNNGMDTDKLLELAIERGYLPEGSVVDDLVQGMVNEQRGGQAKFATADLGDAAAHDTARANKEFWQREFATKGLDPVKMTDSQWRDFYDELSGIDNRGTPATLEDLEMQPSEGRTMGSLHKTVSALQDQFFGDGGAEAPAYVRSFFNDVINSDDAVGLKTLEGWERRANDLAGNASDRTTASFLKAVGRAIGAKASNEAGPARRGALEAARAARREQGSTFESGDVPRALGKDRFGNPTTEDTTLPTKLVRPGAPGGDTADGMIATMGREASERFAREEMRRLTDGANTAAQAQALVQRHAEMLSRFPALRSDLDQWAAASSDADRAAAAARVAPKPTPEETAALSAVSPDEAALKGTPLAAVANPAVEPSSYVGQLLRRADGGRELRRLTDQLASDPKALDGARRSMAEYIEATGKGPNVTAAGENVPSANPTRKAIQTVLQRGGKLVTGQQRIVLEKIAKELEGVNFASSAGRPAGSETAMNKTFTGIIGKQIIGTAGPGTKLLTHALELMGNGQQVQRFITDAILEPKFAAELLTRATPQRLAALRARLQSASTGTAAGDQPE
jgi:hypothetical protein